MAKAVDLKCPECGARIHTPPQGDVATCDYCGTKTQVQRREGVFERKVHLPPQVAVHVQNLPVAIQTHTKRFVVFMLVLTIGLPIAITGMVGFLVCNQKKKVARTIAAAKAKSQARHSWSVHSAVPMLADVNGDGVTDIIGRIRYFRKAPNLVYAAVDAKTGAHIWESAAMADKNLSQSRGAIVGGRLLLADALGAITAFNLKDGKELWKAPLGERVDSICGGPSGTALVRLKDKRTKQVSVKDGGVTDVTDPVCKWVPTDRDDAPPEGIHFPTKSPSSGGKKVSALPGMSVGKVWERSADGAMFALGTRKPGTRVPMIARFKMNDKLPEKPPRFRRNGMSRAEYREARRAHSKKMRAYYTALRESRGTTLWKADVPGVNALKASTGAPEHIGVGQTILLVPYSLRSGPIRTRVAAFAIADGKRLWDVSVPKGGPGSNRIEHLGMSKTHAFVSYGSNLAVLQLADGKLMFSLGRE